MRAFGLLVPTQVGISTAKIVLSRAQGSYNRAMPVLTCKPEEEIVIRKRDDEIVISVLDSVGHPVQLGIEAPEDYRIARAELLEESEG